MNAAKIMMVTWSIIINTFIMVKGKKKKKKHTDTSTKLLYSKKKETKTKLTSSVFSFDT